MFTFTIFIQIVLEILAREIKEEKEIKDVNFYVQTLKLAVTDKC
jgi:hypothetical protein